MTGVMAQTVLAPVQAATATATPPAGIAIPARFETRDVVPARFGARETLDGTFDVSIVAQIDAGQARPWRRPSP